MSSTFFSTISCGKTFFFFFSPPVFCCFGKVSAMTFLRTAEQMPGSPTLINVWQASGSRLQVASAKSTLTGETRRAASVSGAHVPRVYARRCRDARVCVFGLKKKVVLTTEAATCAPVMKRARRPFCLIKRRYVRGGQRGRRGEDRWLKRARALFTRLPFFPPPPTSTISGLIFIKSPAVLPEHGRSGVNGFVKEIQTTPR